MTFDPTAIRIGDYLCVDPFLNTRAGPRLRLPSVCKVLAKKREEDGRAVHFSVVTLTGIECWVDARWFTAKVPAPEGSQ